MSETIAERLNLLRERIAVAAVAAGRNAADVSLVVVTKNATVAEVASAARAGQRDFGENRVQEALQKSIALSGLAIRWHLLGHLQSNKIRKATAAFPVIHSVDSIDVLKKIDSSAADVGTSPKILIQVDLATEETKFGIPPALVPKLLEAGERCVAARVVGLMMLPPFSKNPENARQWFKRLHELKNQWLAEGVPPAMLHELSMGMSTDFKVAVEEGATMIRIGTAIFGTRQSQT